MNVHRVPKISSRSSQSRQSRRSFLSAAFAAGAGLATALLPRYALDANASRAYLAAAPNFSLPVADSERDFRTTHIAHAKLLVSDALKSDVAPPEVAVEKIAFNPEYTHWEAINRLDVATANALIRAHVMSTQFLDGENYMELRRFIRSGETPPEPNWGEYLKRLDDPSDHLTFSLMAIPGDAPAEPANVQWMEASVRKGIRFNFTHEPGLITTGFDADTLSPLITTTIRVNDEKQIQLDIFPNMALFIPSPDELINSNITIQDVYSFWYCGLLLEALEALTMSLGIIYGFDSGQNIYQRDFGAGRPKTHIPGSIFIEQLDLLLGPQTDAGFPDNVLKVKLKQ